jgi:hypothetical protein
MFEASGLYAVFGLQLCSHTFNTHLFSLSAPEYRDTSALNFPCFNTCPRSLVQGCLYGVFEASRMQLSGQYSRPLLHSCRVLECLLLKLTLVDQITFLSHPRHHYHISLSRYIQ